MVTKRLTFAVLGIFLVLTGLIYLVPGLGDIGVVVSVFALAAGGLLLITRMDISNRQGWLLLAAYLILTGLNGVIGFTFSGLQALLAIVILVGGVVLLTGWRNAKGNIGFFLFCLWAIVKGLTYWMSFSNQTLAISVLALLSGTLLILKEYRA